MTQHSLGDFQFELISMSSDDRQRVLDFARELEPHDLLFLRKDITSEKVADDWISSIEEDRVQTLLALSQDQRVLGYATLDRSGQAWTQHVGELRVVVGKSARGVGLGRFLTEQVFRMALDRGVEKLMARMTLDQEGAIAVFETLGFRPEGLLKDHVVDRSGAKHDLLVMAHSVADFQATMDGFGVTQALHDAQRAAP